MTSGSRSLRAAALGAAFLLIIAASVSNPASAQQGGGRIAGRVSDDQTGAGVAGVTVVLNHPAPRDAGAPRQELQETDSDGKYAFASVPAGRYRIEFLKAGYDSASITDFEVISGRESRADSKISPRAGAAAEGGEAESTPPDAGPVESITIHGSTAADLLGSIEKRQEADQLVNLLSAEELGKFAAVDVADALKRVAGVNVVEGRFAVIRGLEDRYSSTTFNSAPVPSADPLRQSVQLDLFPSDVVSDIVIAKSFEAAAQGNSGAGSIDIGTRGYPEELTLKLSGGGGFNDNAIDEFAGYQSNSPIADFKDGSDVIESDFGGSIGGSWTLADREVRMKLIAANEIDYDTALGRVEGKEPRLPSCRDLGGNLTQCQSTGAAIVDQSGGLAIKSLTVSDGVFDYTLSERDEQLTLFGGLGVDVDQEGAHRIDFTAFHTDKEIESVERLDDGVIAGFDYANTPVENFTSPFELYRAGSRSGDAVATVGGLISDFRGDPGVAELPDGPLGIDPIVRGQSVVQDRKLSIYQLNGRHLLDALLDGLDFDWAANYARTQQDETSFRMRYWYEPYAATSFDGDNLPVPPFPPQESHFAAFGPGSWRTNTRDIIFNENEIDETQWFGRGDLTYEVDAADWLGLETGAGFWVERADRTLEFTDFQGNGAIPGRPGVLTSALVEGPTESQLGPNVFGAYGLGDLRLSESEFEREITAGAFSLKGTFWDDIDLIGGLRLEQIKIVSENRPFTPLCRPPSGQPGGVFDPSRSGRGCPPGYLPEIFPGRYLYLDRQDNPSNPFLVEDPLFAPFGHHDQILGIDLPVNANGFVDQLTPDDLFNVLTGEINEFEIFPSVTGAYRPIDGMTLRAAYSQTSARPSFRELAYYASIVPGEDERLVGNPFLQLSDVTSYDARADYVWGDFGDLIAFSFFYKTIDHPIEVIQLRDYSVAAFPLFEGPFRVYRNNENEAELIGGEAEARLTLGVLSDWAWAWPSTRGYADGLRFLEDLSVGGNVTYIDAKVERSSFERRFGDLFYLASGDNPRQPPGSRLPRERRLFNQPEWIVNGDVTFDQPDWGTKLTLSVFAISDVLRTAGSPTVARGGQTIGLTLDEYTAPFYQLDFVVSQSFEVPIVPGTFTLKTAVKNLTDSRRGVVYDTEVVSGTQYERRFYIGRDYSFALQYELVFDGSVWSRFLRD